MTQAGEAYVSILIFSAVTLAALGTAQLLLGHRDQRSRLARRLADARSGLQKNGAAAALVKRQALSFADPMLARLHDFTAFYCRQAGVSLSPLRLVTVCGAGALTIWLLSLLLFDVGGSFGLITRGSIALVISAALSSAIAAIWLARRRSARLKALEVQLPLALDVVNRGLRAGHPVVAAVQLASEEIGEPITSEFRLIVDETNYGIEFKDALTNFAQRTGSPDARFFAVSVGIQSETGGNLAEVLEGLAKLIRSRATLAKRVKALSSEGRASALLLSVLPVLLVASIMFLHPAFYTSKFSDPIFWQVVCAVGLLYLLGLAMIHRIINFRY
ncbi:MAG TPA: type II secretion system F family protein [Rhizomicrobium sp.]|nr:type II secretion system F family protein [Rhizomicrobium sp.]